MRTNPLAAICIFFCLGIWVATLIHIPLFFVLISCGLLLLAALVGLQKKVLFSLSLSVAIFLAGFLHFSNTQIYPAHHISNFVSDEGQRVYVMGRVTSNPETSQTFYHSQKTSFTFNVSELKIEEKWQPVEGLVKATCYGERRIQYADQLLLQGLLGQPPGLRNPGGFNYRTFLANHNIFGLLKVKEKDALQVISSKKGPSFVRRIFKFKQRLHNIIYQHLKPEQAALLSAILLGERTNLSQDVKDLFISTGTIHILAISGLHVGLIALILVLLLRFLRLGRKPVFILTILLLISYAYLSGARPSVVRATIMAVVVLTGHLLNREVNIYNSLGLAALVILIANPEHLFDAGFQLSFLSVISIVYFAPKIKAPRALSVSLAAWAGIAPLVAYYFNIVSPVAIVANLVIIPLLFLAVSTGIVFLIFASFWAGLGPVLAQTCWLSLLGLTKAAWLFSKIPLGFFHCPKPGILFFCVYYGLLLLLFNYQKLRLSSGKLAIILSLAANVFICRPLFERPAESLSVTFLDVGHGDAIFIELPQSKTILIDGGRGGENDAGRWVVLPFLWNKGIGEIDAVVFSHSDDDHVGGLVSVLKNVKVNYVFDSGMPKDSAGFSNYKMMIEKEAPFYRALKRGERVLGFPGIELFVIHPSGPLSLGPAADTNNNSLILKLVYKNVSFLFCGDIKEEAMEELLAYQPMLNSTVLKVPHHGSDEGKLGERFFEAVSAQVAVISADRNKRFKFAAPAVIQRLEDLGAQVYTTAESGAVTVSTDGEDVWVRTML